MKTNYLFITFMLLGALLLAGCSPVIRVGDLRNESQSVEMDGSRQVRVEIDFGAGDLELAGGAEELLEADFTYNVAKLKPQVKYTAGSLVVRQPDTNGLPDLKGILTFRNDWDLRLSGGVPMDLTVNVGGGSSDLQLSGLSLRRLDVDLGAGRSTVDLRGNWERDVDVTIDVGAADTTIMLPGAVGVRVEVDPGASMVNASGLFKRGNVYTNAAYSASDVTLRIDLAAGIGFVNLEVEDAATALDNSSN